MASRFGFTFLIPFGLTADTVFDDDGSLIVAAGSSAAMAACPLCGASAHRIKHERE